jgi:hypothetical protein
MCYELNLLEMNSVHELDPLITVLSEMNPVRYPQWVTLHF